MSEQRHVLHWSFRSPFVKRVLLAADELGAASISSMFVLWYQLIIFNTPFLKTTH